MSDERAGLLDGAIAPVSNIKLFGHEAAEEFLAGFRNLVARLYGDAATRERRRGFSGRSASRG